jgi:acetyltransferase-like isoleucine patch superfamily enzyme
MSIIHAREVDIGADVQIGHGNVVIGVGTFRVGEHARIGHLNVFRGGHTIDLGRWVEILRMNQINSIPDPVVVNPTDPRFTLGDAAMLGSNHKIDFTDRVTIGRRSFLGGRNSSLWTHNRQRTAPITVGDHCYLGSEVRVAPGSVLPSESILGMGSVVVDDLGGCVGWLLAGVPAKPVHELDDDDLALVKRKTREDLPDDV